MRLSEIGRKDRKTPKGDSDFPREGAEAERFGLRVKMRTLNLREISPNVDSNMVSRCKHSGLLTEWGRFAAGRNDFMTDKSRTVPVSSGAEAFLAQMRALGSVRYMFANTGTDHGPLIEAMAQRASRTIHAIFS